MKNSPSYTGNYFCQFTSSGSDVGLNTIEILGIDAEFRRIYNILIKVNTPCGALLWLCKDSNEYRLCPVNVNVHTIPVNLVNIDDASSIFQKKCDRNGSRYFDIPAGWSLKLGAAPDSDFNFSSIVSGEKL